MAVITQTVQLPMKSADGYVIPLGPVNLVLIKTDIGMVGCGAFDLAALEKFGYPAARARGADTTSIATIDDLLASIVKDVNPSAERRGIRVDMSVREALGLL
jgi:uncharacterized protein YunC (DUF1805 family)